MVSTEHSKEREFMGTDTIRTGKETHPRKKRSNSAPARKGSAEADCSEKKKEILLGMTFEQFIDHERRHRNELATAAFERLYRGMGQDAEMPFDELDMRIRYLNECFTDVQMSQIVNLWALWRQDCESNGFRDSHLLLLPIARLTMRAGASTEERSAFDEKTVGFLREIFVEQIEQRKFFSEGISNIIQWYKFRMQEYLPILGIGPTLDELATLKTIYRRYGRELSSMKSDDPQLFLQFSSIYIAYYTVFSRLSDDLFDGYSYTMASEYSDIYEQMCLDRIIVTRNCGRLDEMSKSIYLYYSMKLRNRRWRRKFLEYSCGYGEKPSRLAFLFLLYHVFFLVIFMTPFFEFVGVDDLSFFKRTVSMVYFNSATMLTVGYGDIHPSNVAAMIAVIVEQMIGFLTAGAFITLSLRKLFRF